MPALKRLGAEWLAIAAIVAAAVALVAALSSPSAPTLALEPLSGFGSSEPQGGDARARWLTEDPAVGALTIAEPPRSGIVTLRASSFGESRDVVIVVAGARPVRATAVPGRFTDIPIDMSGAGPGTYRMVITTSPGPASLVAVSGGTDARAVSLRMLEPLVLGGSDDSSAGQAVSTVAWWTVMLFGVLWFMSLVWRASRMADRSPHPGD